MKSAQNTLKTSSISKASQSIDDIDWDFLEVNIKYALEKWGVNKAIREGYNDSRYFPP